MVKHIEQIRQTNGTFKTSKGKYVNVFQIVVPADDELISSWAKHFREQYCNDDELDELIDGSQYERDKGQYLKDIVFPSGTSPGPSFRSGDFAEVLLADYLEYTKNFWVPRNRLNHKATQNESVKGSDIIAIKFKEDGKISPDDILAVFESKAKLSKKSNKTLQNAIDHSGKDYLRLACTLNATKRRYLQSKDQVSADKIKRFQNMEDEPYTELSGAAAFCTTDSIDDPVFFDVDESDHPQKENLHLFVFHGTDLMKFVHKLFKRAIDETK